VIGNVLNLYSFRLNYKQGDRYEWGMSKYKIIG